MKYHVLLTLLACVLPLAADAEDPPATEDVAVAKTDVASYTIKTAAGTPLELRPEPVLFWSNPIRNSGQSGAVFVWMHEGRPAAIASRFTFKYADTLRLKHEFHSLAAEPLRAEYRETRAWTPETAGVNFQPIPDAAKPAAAERLRLLQMKSLARAFAVTLTDPDGGPNSLRLVPQPLLRYGRPEGPATDGAIFAWSLGTDPEALLLIEARTGSTGAPHWEYAFARFHYWPLEATRDGKRVWSAAPALENMFYKLGDATGRTQPYFSYGVPIEQGVNTQ